MPTSIFEIELLRSRKSNDGTDGGVSWAVQYSPDSAEAVFQNADSAGLGSILDVLEALTVMTARRRVLFLCTGNSCRSQMAEGFLRSLFGQQIEALSAGAKPAGYVHPRAVTVMAEVGVDISGQVSKSINDFLPPKGTPPDVVIGVCSTANENCPTFPAAVERWHWPFDDPFHASGSEEEQMSEFRRVRDEVRARIEKEFGA